MEPLLLTLDLRDDNVFLNDAIVKALGYPAQVQLAINKVDRTIAVQACAMTDKEAIVIPNKHTAMLEISARDLSKKIRQLTGWDDKCLRVFSGESFPLYQAVQFYLDDAMLIPTAQVPSILEARQSITGNSPKTKPIKSVKKALQAQALASPDRTFEPEPDLSQGTNSLTDASRTDMHEANVTEVEEQKGASNG